MAVSEEPTLRFRSERIQQHKVSLLPNKLTSMPNKLTSPNKLERIQRTDFVQSEHSQQPNKLTCAE